MKGVSANLGAETLSELAHRVELSGTRKADKEKTQIELDAVRAEWDRVKSFLREEVLA